MNSFEELACWKEGVKLRKKVSRIVKKLPGDEKYALSSQMLRCSRSVTNNIAEGFGRYHYKENTQFCRQARGSLFELKDHILIAFEEDYINQDEKQALVTQCELCIKILNGYIKYLSNAGNRVYEDEALYNDAELLNN